MMMKRYPLAAVTAAIALIALYAQAAMPPKETREQAAAALRKPETKEMDASFTKAAPFAQKLVDEALAKHPQVLLLAIHAGAPRYDIVASNFGRIGKLGDEDDLRCIRTATDNLEVNKQGNHYEDQTVLRDRNGKIIGAIGIVFSYKPGDDKVALQRIAHDVAKEMQAKIPDAQTLLGPE